MRLLILTDAEADDLLAWCNEPLRSKLLVQITDPLLAAPGPRTILIRDEGVRPVMLVNYDRREDADAAWTEMGVGGDDGVVEEGAITWPAR